MCTIKFRNFTLFLAKEETYRWSLICKSWYLKWSCCYGPFLNFKSTCSWIIPYWNKHIFWCPISHWRILQHLLLDFFLCTKEAYFLYCIEVDMLPYNMHWPRQFQTRYCFGACWNQNVSEYTFFFISILGNFWNPKNKGKRKIVQLGFNPNFCMPQ